MPECQAFIDERRVNGYVIVICRKREIERESGIYWEGVCWNCKVQGKR